MLRVDYSFWKGVILTPMLVYIHHCLPSSLFAMCRVEYSFMEGAILTPRLFHIYPCLMASFVVISRMNHLHLLASFMARVDSSIWKGVILTPRLFYIHPCLPASPFVLVMFRVEYSVCNITLFVVHRVNLICISPMVHPKNY